MNIKKTGMNFRGVKMYSFIPKSSGQAKYIKDSCYKLSMILGNPASELLNLTKDSDMNRFSFLKCMVNKYNFNNRKNIPDNSDYILNIYSKIVKPTPMHFSIVNKTADSFESIERIFSLAQDNKSLEFVQDLQYGVLKDSRNSSKIIIDLLSSKYSKKYIDNINNYSSYLKLNEDNRNAVANLDKLISSNKYSKFRYDAQLAIKNLTRNKRIQVVTAGKTHDLELAYSEERESFLRKIVRNLIPSRTSPSEATKATVVDMYRTLKPENTQLRYDIIDRFKNRNPKEQSAEIVEMKILFDKIDKDKDVKKFVQKAIIKDLKIPSIAEMNEILDNAPLKKVNVFFNNAKRIIEQSGRNERNIALIKELENPFYKPSKYQSNAKKIRLYSPYEQEDGLLSKTARFIENKINQFIYYYMAA